MTTLMHASCLSRKRAIHRRRIFETDPVRDDERWIDLAAFDPLEQQRHVLVHVRLTHATCRRASVTRLRCTMNRGRLSRRRQKLVNLATGTPSGSIPNVDVGDRRRGRFSCVGLEHGHSGRSASGR